MLNEGLEQLISEDGYYDDDKYGSSHPYKGIFYRSGLEEVVLPSTLKEICGGVFADCENLRRVVLNEGL